MMPKKATSLSVAACLLSLIALGVGGVAWMQAWMNQPIAAPGPGEPIELGDVAAVATAEGDLRLDLSSLDEGGNTQVIWHCGKSLLGSRHDFSGAWGSLGGWLLLAPSARELRAGELHIALGSMRGHGAHPAPNALINTVRENQWFLEDEHPTAVFRGSTITPRSEAEQSAFERTVEDWTHTITGTFQLNGIERELAIPARVEVAADSVALDAIFPISRAEFEVAKRRGFEPPSDVDDQVVIELHVHASPDPMSVVAELNRQLVAQQAATGLLDTRAAEMAARMNRLEATIEELRRDLRLGTAAATRVDPASLPARFADSVDYSNSRGDERYKDLGYVAEFEMVLAPGDPAQGIAPFYVQTTEVTWEMFRTWSYCEDIADETHALELREAELRPSPCYDDASRGHGFDRRAALGVSRRNAVAFCRYMSEMTGRAYRLMTGVEWSYLAEATGGLPEDLHRVAWLAGNSDCDDFGDPLPMAVGIKPADDLGLHDFWGNLAEWVMDDTQYVRGGSYLVEAADLTPDWRVDESQDVWNETYPNSPKSKWWYRDRFDMGFRLVCDPLNIPEDQ